MARIRHKRTLVEMTVPDRAVPYFPDYDVVQPEETVQDKPPRAASKRAAAEPTTTEE